MKNYFYSFLKKNKKLIKTDYNKSKYFFLIDRGKGHYISALHASILGGVINEKYKIDPVVISDLDKREDIINLYKSFGYLNYLTGFRYKYIFFNMIRIFLSIIILFKGIYLVKRYSFYGFVTKFNIRNIFIGDLIFNSYIRYEKKFLNPKIDFQFINILFTSIYRTLNLFDYFEKYKPKYVIVATQSYANNHAISIKICVHKKIKVYEPYFERYSREYRLRTYDKKKIEYGYQNTFSKDFKKNVINKKIKVKRLNVFLKKRIRGQIITSYTGDRDLRYSNNSKRKWSLNELLKFYRLSHKKFEKIILLAPHAFTDAPHCRGNIFLFRDYFSQTIETLNFINEKIKSQKVLWILRPHPTSIIEYGEEGLVKEMVNELNNPLIKLCPSNINTDNILDLVDGVITGRGTIGLEAAIKGKKTLIAGGASYSGLGLAIESKSKKMYFNKINDLKCFTKLSKEKIYLAKKTLYYFDTKKIELKESKILNEKIRLKKKQQDVFCKSLLKSYNKIGFKKDPLYINLMKVV